MKKSFFLLTNYRESYDYPDWATVRVLNDRRHLSNIRFLWKDCSPLYILLQEKRFAERQACKAKNWKVCQYWCDRADMLSRRIRIDRHWYAKFEKALACEQWAKARRILHVAMGSWHYAHRKFIDWNWNSTHNRPVSDFPNGSIPEPNNREV